jgi:hypothetical protein
MRTADHSRGRWARRTLYWLAVTVVSLALVALLLGVIHSFDGSTVGIVAIHG